MIDVRDFGGDIQRAIDAALGGNSVYVPAGAYHVSGLTVPRLPTYMGALTPQLTIFGDGQNATTIFCDDPDRDILSISRSVVTVRELLLAGPGGSGKGRGVSIAPPAGEVLCRIRLADVYVTVTGRESLYVADGGIAIECAYDRVTFDGNLAGDLAYIGRQNTTQCFTQCNFTSFKGHALLLNGTDTTSLRDCLIEDGDNAKPWVEGLSAVGTLLDHVYFEDHRPDGTTATFTKHDKASTNWVERDPVYRRR